MLCRRCGVEVGETLKYCKDCASLLAEPGEQDNVPGQLEIPNEVDAGGQSDNVVLEEEPQLSLSGLFIFIFLPVLAGFILIFWVLAKNGVIGNIAKKSGVEDLVKVSKPSGRPSAQELNKKIEFELGVDGVKGLMTIFGVQVPVWKHDIALQRPEQNIAIKFSEKTDSALSVARPASQKLSQPLILKLRMKRGESKCSIESLAGYLLLFNYMGEKMSVSRLNDSSNPLKNEISELECETAIGSVMRGKFKGEAITQSGKTIAWDLIVDGQIDGLE